MTTAIMNRKKFRIKKEPVKPLLKNYRGRSHSDTVGEPYETIDPYKLSEQLENARLTDPKAYIELELDHSGCYYESDTPDARLVLKWRGPAQAEFDTALGRYQENMTQYQAWYDENKAAIAGELKIREAEASVAALAKANRLEKQAARLRKQNTK